MFFVGAGIWSSVEDDENKNKQKRYVIGAQWRQGNAKLIVSIQVEDGVCRGYHSMCGSKDREFPVWTGHQ